MLNDFWYNERGDELARKLFDYLNRLHEDQAYRQEENFKFMRLYGNLEASALRSYSFYRAEPVAMIQHRVTLNIIQSMIDTVVSKLSKNKPRVSFLTDGGDWGISRKAKKLTQFMDGQLYLTDYYAKRALAIQDSCIFGTGALKVFREGRNIKLERTFIDELIVDDTESIYGHPRQMHQKKYIHKDVLKSMFPKKAASIDAVTSMHMNSTYQYSGVSTTPHNMIETVESWKLPSGPDADDGLHTITIKELTLHEEPYTKSYFPFLFWRWGIRPLGFWGQGLAEQLTGIQLEINKILRTIQVSMHLVSVPKLYVEAASKIVSSHLNNKIGGIVKYVGQPPIEGKLGSIPAELFAHLDRLYTRAFEIAGISQLSAMAAKPQGLNSGKALREYNDIESERFMAIAQRDEAVCLEAAKMFIDLAKEINEEYGDYAVRSVSGRRALSIKWEDVDLESDAYVMQSFPVSALSKTPAGRMQDVQELLGAGFISRSDAVKLLDFPDLQQFYNMETAGAENIDRLIEQMIDEGAYSTPEPYDDLQYGINKMQQAYNLYKSQGAPDERLELFRRWIEDANTLLTKAQQEIAAAQQAAQMQAEQMMQAQQAPESANQPAAQEAALGAIPAPGTT